MKAAGTHPEKGRTMTDYDAVPAPSRTAELRTLQAARDAVAVQRRLTAAGAPREEIAAAAAEAEARQSEVARLYGDTGPRPPRVDRTLAAPEARSYAPRKRPALPVNPVV